MSSQRRQILTLEIERAVLPNGLVVLLQPDRSIPLVAVNVWYGVGSKDETPGRTGLAHLFEHLMFEGSANHDDDYFRPLQEAGALVNGSTSNDRTQYHEVVPANFLDLALWMESERMANLLPALTEAKLANQKSVVLNERRQRYDNRPYGRVGEAIGRAMYADDHPYAWPVIGWAADIAAATLEDAREFHRRHYRPSNATLCLAGSFDPDVALRAIEATFGWIADSNVTTRSRPTQQAGRLRHNRERMEDAVSLGRLDAIWHTGPRYSADEAALDVAAEILAGRSKDSRLKRRLVLGERLVRNIAAGNDTSLLAGRFHIRCHALPGVDLGRVEAAILDEIEGLLREPPTGDEVERVQRDFEHSMYSRMETALGRTNAICHRQFMTGQVEGDFIARELEDYLAVRSDDVVRVVAQYLRGPFAAIEVVPGRVDAVPIEPPTESPPKSRTGAKAVLPRPGPQPPFQLPRVEWLQLDCGMRMVVATTRKLPRVDIDLLLPLGAAADPPRQEGLNRLLSECLDEGAGDRDTVALNRALDRLGARLGASSGLESSGVAMQCLADRIEESLAIFAEVVTRPRLDVGDLERERARLLSELAHRENEPSWLADNAFDEIVYGSDHPYGRSGDGTRETIAALTRDRLTQFHREHYVADDSALVVVGCVDVDRIAQLVDQSMAGFMSKRRLNSAPTANRLPVGTAERRRLVVRPNSAQATLRVGMLGPSRDTPDYFALQLLNVALGGHFSSRLNARLREEKGLTYGVRSSFNLRRIAGDFLVASDVQATGARDAIRDIIAEIDALSTGRPLDQGELDYAKTYVSRRFPSRFETAGGIGSAIAQIVLYRLPVDYYETYLERVAAVDVAAIHEAACRHLAINKVKIAAVGDAAALSDLDGLLPT